MKRLTTVICCLAFMICGISLAIHGNDSPLTATVSAANYRPEYVDLSKFVMPLDLLLDQAKNSQKTDLIDSTSYKDPVVTTVDNHVEKAPVVIERIKEVEVPVLYIATPTDSSTESDSPPYSVHKLDNGGIGITVPSSLGVEPYEE